MRKFTNPDACSKLTEAAALPCCNATNMFAHASESFAIDPLETFRNNFADPKKVNTCEISAQLFSAGLISKEEKDEADNSKGAPLEERSAKLLLDIETVIIADDTKTKFDEFISVLEKVSKYQEVVKKIKGNSRY